MDLFGQTLVLYLVIGLGVAVAAYVTSRGQRVGRLFLIVTALAFWPLFLPILLTRSREDDKPIATTTTTHDSLADAIKQVDTELEAALGSLNGWAEGVLSREKGRIADLRASWSMQAQRIRDMDRILSADEPLIENSAASIEGDTQIRNCRQGRMHNIDRLRRVRHRAADDLARSLASVRELVSLIHLARFSGAPAARAEELVAEIAAAVAGLEEREDATSEPEA